MALFNVLGVDIALTEKKDKPFAKTFEPLGVKVVFSGSSSGVIKIMPKESRVVGGSEEVKEYLDKGSMRGVEANALGQRIRSFEGDALRAMRVQGAIGPDEAFASSRGSSRVERGVKEQLGLADRFPPTGVPEKRSG